jgi:hypothetical protein
MKRISVFVLAVFVLAVFVAPFVLAKEDFDLQTVKKAVKKNPQYEKGKEVEWFKLLIMDNDDQNERLEITLPIALVDLLFQCTKDKRMNIDCGDYDIDLRELYREIKRRGPRTLIEIKGEDGVLKIWME